MSYEEMKNKNETDMLIEGGVFFDPAILVAKYKQLEKEYDNAVNVPFRKNFYVRLCVDQTKTATTRTKKYGEKGEYFKAFKHLFRFTDVRRVTLGYVATLYYKEEGFSCLEEFICIWNIIHPRKKFDAKQKVWLHLFKLM